MEKQIRVPLTFEDLEELQNGKTFEWVFQPEGSDEYVGIVLFQKEEGEDGVVVEEHDEKSWQELRAEAVYHGILEGDTWNYEAVDFDDVGDDAFDFEGETTNDEIETAINKSLLSNGYKWLEFNYNGAEVYALVKTTDIKNFLIGVLMDIRRIWVLDDYKISYGDGEIDLTGMNQLEMRNAMEEHIFHKYDIDYLKEVIEVESRE